MERLSAKQIATRTHSALIGAGVVGRSIENMQAALGVAAGATAWPHDSPDTWRRHAVESGAPHGPEQRLLMSLVSFQIWRAGGDHV